MTARSKLIFLPRMASAGICFAVYKIALIILFLAYTIYVAFWTWYCMEQFQKIVDANPNVMHSVAINKTHKHFFLFTGLFVLSASLIGLWGVLREYIPVIFAYVIMSVLSLVFEMVGAMKSKDPDVLKYKSCTAVPELLMMIISFIFCFMIRSVERKLANLPIYRQTMAESRRESFVENAAEGVESPAMVADEESKQDSSKAAEKVELPTPEFKGKSFLEIPSSTSRSSD